MKKILTTLLLLCAIGATAQCEYKNTAFKCGEFLSYNLYYNWKFVWVKAGSATMYIVDTKYKGKEAYRASLTTRGSEAADKMFVLRDTLLCYTTKGLAPLYFRKGAKEGERYTVDEVWYTYGGNHPSLQQRYRNKKGEIKDKRYSSNECVYDMLSMFLRARSFDPTNWKKGHTIDFPMADGDDVSKVRLKYQGKSKIKADNDKTYKCLELSYLEFEDNQWKEIVRFYVTDDTNHVPIRIDMFLKFGSAKAFLTNMKGVN